ncbi:Ig-like domain (group 2) [Anaerocolumna jejuensis DSM 15929]|uniref:Ig-like domain (Group 2) n=1 Tax=Anaerocolumna jejuensis DSM 15929 TaxID=1121322 RepID=A0A1M6JLR7_9FIRM|nr:Ig-like domain-containing protein [Anaerocolumna jejuensis]SHJ47580.1 Ig-like domain (group 2) [Anaerocolumna jejuensis DSM 15929]
MRKLRKVRLPLLFILTVMLLVSTGYPVKGQKVEAAAAKINKSALTLYIGDTYKLKMSKPAAAVSWISSNNSIVTVTLQGKVTAYKKGTAVITALEGKKKSTCRITVRPRTEAQVSKKIEGLRNKYPQGMSWDNSKLYVSKYEPNVIGGGCYAFASRISDIAFGYSPAETHQDFEKIRIGDTIRIGDYHSVVVLTKSDTSITVVEGNVNSAVNWDRKISKEDLELEGFQVTTRY